MSLCREESQESCVSKQPASLPPSQGEPSPEAPRHRVQPPPGIGLSPNVLRDVLTGVAEDPDHALAPRGAGEQPRDADGHLDKARAVAPNTAPPAMESDAVLWASHNLWFGVEEDMTAAAYKVWPSLAHADCATACHCEQIVVLVPQHRKGKAGQNPPQNKQVIV